MIVSRVAKENRINEHRRKTPQLLPYIIIHVGSTVIEHLYKIHLKLIVILCSYMGLTKITIQLIIVSHGVYSDLVLVTNLASQPSVYRKRHWYLLSILVKTFNNIFHRSISAYCRV